MHARAHIKAGKFEAADVSFQKAIKGEPGNAHLLLEYAFAAERQGDLDEFINRAEAAREKIPSFALAHAVYGGGLRKKRLFREARSVLDQAFAEFPDVPEVAIEKATLAQAMNELDEAARQFTDIMARFPNRVEGPVGLSTALCSQLKFDESDAILAGAILRFGDEILIYSHYATNADIRGDKQESLRRWKDALTRFPKVPVVHAGYASALKSLGQFEMADQAFDVAMQRFPDDLNLRINHAWNAEAQGKWDEAETRWRVLIERFPKNAHVREGMSESLMKAQLAALDLASPYRDIDRRSVSLMQVETINELAPRDLVSRFESLGDNCELGFVQRHFRAEPLGLVRWAGISLDQLIMGLETDFKGVGEREFTTMAVNPHNHEYYTEDSRFWLSMHSFILKDEANETKIYGKLCSRLRYLKERLIEDLHEGDKIFVFQTGHLISDAKILSLYNALQRHTRNTLLFVQSDGDRKKPGSVEIRGERLYYGYLSKVGYDGKLWDIKFEEWFAICSEVYKNRYLTAAVDPTTTLS